MDDFIKRPENKVNKLGLQTFSTPNTDCVFLELMDEDEDMLGYVKIDEIDKRWIVLHTGDSDLIIPLDEIDRMSSVAKKCVHNVPDIDVESENQ